MPQESEPLPISILPDLASISKSLQPIISSIVQAWPFTHYEPSVFVHRTAPMRLEQSHKVERALRNVEEILEPVSSMVNMLYRLESQLKVRKARLQMALNPVSALPDDVLALIFDLSVNKNQLNGVDTSWKVSMKLSQVSAHWRAVAIDSSQLWSRLTLVNPSQVRLIPTFAQRSRNKRLALTIMEFHPLSPDELIPWQPADIEILASFAGQISEIYVPSCLFCDETVVLAVEEEAIAELNLQYLHIRGQESLLPWPDPLISATRHLRLSQIPLQLSSLSRPELLHLEELTMGSLYYNDAAFSCLHDVAMPALRRLILIHNGSDDEFIQEYMGPSITMPSVETLEIRHCSERMWPSIGVEILLPNLQSVLVETYDITGTNSLRELIQQNPQIEDFTLETLNSTHCFELLMVSAGAGRPTTVFGEVTSLRSLQLITHRSTKHHPKNIYGAETDTEPALLFQALEPLLLPLSSSSASTAAGNEGVEISPAGTLELLKMPEDLVRNFGDQYRAQVANFVITEDTRDQDDEGGLWDDHPEDWHYQAHW